MSKITFYSAVSTDTVKALVNAKAIAISLGHTWSDGVTVIFNASCIEGLSPNFRGNLTTNEVAITKWVTSYFNDYNNRPSQRTSNPPGTCHDSALDMVIQGRLTDLTRSQLADIKWAHRLSMSAENIFGAILEEYLAVRLKDHGWYCAWGASVKAVDFVCTDGRLLQIKSRNNTENSSSSKIRNGTSIDKWWRFHSTNGSTNWPALNTKLGLRIFSEADFQTFVKQLVRDNPNVMAIEDTNTWKA